MRIHTHYFVSLNDFWNGIGRSYVFEMDTTPYSWINDIIIQSHFSRWCPIWLCCCPLWRCWCLSMHPFSDCSSGEANYGSVYICWAQCQIVYSIYGAQVTVLFTPRLRQVNSFGYSVSISAMIVAVGGCGKECSVGISCGIAYIIENYIGTWSIHPKHFLPSVHHIRMVTLEITVVVNEETDLVGEPVDWALLTSLRQIPVYWLPTSEASSIK